MDGGGNRDGTMKRTRGPRKPERERLREAHEPNIHRGRESLPGPRARVLSTERVRYCCSAGS